MAYGRTARSVTTRRTPGLLFARAKPTPKGETKSFPKEMLLRAVGAMLTFLGTTAGTVITVRMDDKKWERETSYSVRSSVFNKRIDLIERLARLRGQAQYYGKVSEGAEKLEELAALLKHSNHADFDRALGIQITYQQSS